MKRGAIIRFASSSNNGDSKEGRFFRILPNLDTPLVNATKHVIDGVDARARADVNLVIELSDALARAEVLSSRACDRVRRGLSEFYRWSTFMARANAMGLTQGLDMSRQIAQRVRLIGTASDSDDEFAALADDWANIHLEEDDLEEPLDEDFEVVRLAPDEWDRITAAAFEVDTQVVYDTVIKGRWTVRGGKCHFEDKKSPNSPPDTSH